MESGNHKSIDKFLDRMPSRSYNCFNFVCEVWQYLKGEDVTKRLHSQFETNKFHRIGRRTFTELKEPISPCFVVMQRSKFNPHFGIYLDGRILHLRNNGVEFQPPQIAKWHYTNLRYCI